MTWVVGAATPFGQAFSIGDTRVTFSDGREADMVQKVYWIGPDMSAGFAGSVKIGFHLLTDLSRKLRPAATESVIWKPEAVARRWSIEAASLFEKHSEEEKRAQCSILISAVTPRQNGPFAATVLIEMRAPTFEPRVLPRYGAIQVGSGTQVEVYRTWVEQYFADPRFITNFAAWGTGIGAVLASSLSEKVAENPSPGVSRYMHVVACGRGERSETRVPQVAPWDDQPDPFPEVATSYAKFTAMAKDMGYAAAGAST